MRGGEERGNGRKQSTSMWRAAANQSMLPFADVPRYLFLASRRDVPSAFFAS